MFPKCLFYSTYHRFWFYLGFDILHETSEKYLLTDALTYGKPKFLHTFIFVVSKFIVDIRQQFHCTITDVDKIYHYFDSFAASYHITAKWPEGFLLIVACFNIPPERVQKQRNIFHPVILPYRYAKHNTYKAVSIQIIGTIMCGMVKEFWNILKATLAVIFIKWE